MIDPGCDCSHCLDAIGAATKRGEDPFSDWVDAGDVTGPVSTG